jgi:membrane-associated phospholipid phosphatase
MATIPLFNILSSLLSVISFENTNITYYFFRIITELGSETFFIVVIPPIYWCIDKKFGLRLLIISTISAYITIIIKNITKLARPSYVLKETTYHTYSFPSGHSHGSTSFWLYSSLIYKKYWVIITGIIIVSLVSISRIYLNVHYTSDVLFGIAFGFATVVGFIVLEPLILRLARSWSFKDQLFYAIVPSALLILHSVLNFQIDLQSLKLSSALLGIFLGAVLEHRYVNFSVTTTLKNKIIRTIFGLILAYLAYFGLNFILPTHVLTTFFTAFLGGFTVTFIVPLIFIKFEGNTAPE